MTANQIAFMKAAEERRHNKATEAEAYRSNAAKEQISWVDALSNRQYRSDMAGIGWTNASTQKYQAETQQYQAETQRFSAENEAPLKEAQTRKATADATLDLVQTRKVRADAAKTRKETTYLGQQNVRDWIDTGTTAFEKVTHGVKNVADAAKGIAGWFTAAGF